MTVDEHQRVGQLSSPAILAPALLKSARPRQWSKNLIVFAPLIFDLRLDEPIKVASALAAFACFCAASSGTYLINDIVDRESDRHHPVKRSRPIASGELPVRIAMIASVALITTAILGGALLQPIFGGVVVLYLVLISAYSLVIKHLVILDVFAIAAGFVLRAAGGATALAIPISPWLYVCTVLLALFLGFGKRRHELHLLEHAAANHRRNLDEYTLPLLDHLIVITAAATLMAYSLYTFTAPNLPENHAMMLTIPFVMYGMFRYLYLVYSRERGGAPEQLLLTDLPLLITVVGWASAATIVLYLG